MRLPIQAATTQTATAPPNSLSGTPTAAQKAQAFQGALQSALHTAKSAVSSHTPPAKVSGPPNLSSIVAVTVPNPAVKPDPGPTVQTVHVAPPSGVTDEKEKGQQNSIQPPSGAAAPPVTPALFTTVGGETQPNPLPSPDAILLPGLAPPALPGTLQQPLIGAAAIAPDAPRDSAVAVRTASVASAPSALAPTPAGKKGALPTPLTASAPQPAAGVDGDVDPQAGLRQTANVHQPGAPTAAAPSSAPTAPAAVGQAGGTHLQGPIDLPVENRPPVQEAATSPAGTPPADTVAAAAATRVKATNAVAAASLTTADPAADLGGRVSAPVTGVAAAHAQGTSSPVQPSQSGSSAGLDTFERLDAGVPWNVTPLRTDARNLEVGVQSGSLGWVEVRAASDAQGQISASLHTQSEIAAQSLAGHVERIAAYAQQHAVILDQVSVGTNTGEGSQQQQPSGQRDAHGAVVPAAVEGAASVSSHSEEAESRSLSLISVVA